MGMCDLQLGMIFTTQKHWKLFFSLEDELAWRAAVGWMHHSSVPVWWALVGGWSQTEDGVAQVTAKLSPGKNLGPPSWNSLEKSDSCYKCPSNILINLRMSREPKTCCKIAILLSHLWWVSATWYMHNTFTHSLFLLRSTHNTAACFFKLIWIISNICWGAAVTPHTWVSSAAAQLCTAQEPRWVWEAPASGHPTLVAVSSMLTNKPHMTFFLGAS